MKNVVFIADYTYYKNMNARVCYDFITGVREHNKKYNITIFWTDEESMFVESKVRAINPELIVIFEINNFQPATKHFDFVFSLGIPIYFFMDDTYYINRNTSVCEYTQKVDGIILWYKNEKAKRSYQRAFPKKKILNVSSRFVNTNTYKDWGLPKKYDILLYGSRIYHYEYKREPNEAIQDYIKQYETQTNTIVDNDTKVSFYPLRCKMLSVLSKIDSKYNVRIVPEGCYDSRVANEELSKLINESHLTITCSSIADVLLHKYLEISASKSVILGDVPSDYHDLFHDKVVNINSFMSDDEIIQIIDNALKDKTNLTQKGEELYDIVHKEHNLEQASSSFTQVIDEILIA